MGIGRRAQAVLTYWFGDEKSLDSPNAERLAFWLGQDASRDREIIKKFKADLEKAANGDYSKWKKTPKGSLALIILLHQFPRCMYRNSPGVYYFDEEALDVCLEGIDQQLDQRLSLVERIFYYMPLAHHEDLKMQKYSVAAYHGLVQMSLPELRNIYENFFANAVLHYKLIDEFGRFPHRNAILGRKSTPQESKFLKESGLE
ncbi:MAG: DUF924 family protein [Gammaproteobacteria bacterium]